MNFFVLYRVVSNGCTGFGDDHTVGTSRYIFPDVVRLDFISAAPGLLFSSPTGVVFSARTVSVAIQFSFTRSRDSRLCPFFIIFLPWLSKLELALQLRV